MIKKTIEIKVKAQYVVRDCGEPHWYWLVAHGYGQLAEFIMRHFDGLLDGHKVIAPEGLHHLYLKGSSGRVGASWMTKYEREDDIDQYVTMLDKVLATECDDVDPNIVAFGFSQGAATISRWICRTSFRVKVLVLWAGAWPEDMSITHNRQDMLRMKIFVVIGTEDQYLGTSGISKYLSAFDDHDIPYELIQFEGDHRLDAPTLQTISKKLPE